VEDLGILASCSGREESPMQQLVTCNSCKRILLAYKCAIFPVNARSHMTF
jgi:hypothetical protein